MRWELNPSSYQHTDIISSGSCFTTAGLQETDVLPQKTTPIPPQHFHFRQKSLSQLTIRKSAARKVTVKSKCFAAHHYCFKSVFLIILNRRNLLFSSSLTWDPPRANQNRPIDSSHRLKPRPHLFITVEKKRRPFHDDFIAFLLMKSNSTCIETLYCCSTERIISLWAETPFSSPQRASESR